MDEAVNIEFHHGGWFTYEPRLTYIDGRVYKLDDVNVDTLCYAGFDERIYELGYVNFDCLWWKLKDEDLQEELKVLKSDKDVILMINALKHGNIIEIYVEHNVEDSEVLGEEIGSCPSLPAPPLAEGGSGDEGEYGSDSDVLSHMEDSDEDIDDDLFVQNVDFNLNEEVRRWVEENTAGMADQRAEEKSSEYDDSDELQCPDGSEDEYCGPKYPVFNEAADLSEDFDFKVGMLFTNHKVFKEALNDFSIRKGRDFKYFKNEKRRIAAICVKKSCGWAIRGSLTINGGAFQVKTYHSTHTCGLHYKHTKITAKWLSKKYMHYIRENPKSKITGFIEAVARDYTCQVSRWQCYRAKGIALEHMEGVLGEQYKLVPDYCAAIKKFNPGSTVLCTQQDGHFQRIYICYDACKKGLLAGCRPLIGLDACHLRGVYPGQLFCAIGQDGNDNIYPISFAVCEVENKDTWEWFIGLLLDDIGPVHDHGWTFMSDQQKGLLQAIDELAPGVEHRICVRHLYTNFKKRFRGKSMKDALWAAARAYTYNEFEGCMTKLKVLDNNAYDYLMGNKPDSWARHAFTSRVKSDTLLNNMSECFNSWILEAREKPIIMMLETIRRKLMTRFQQKRARMVKCDGPLCPRITKKLEKNKKESTFTRVSWGGGSKYEVEHRTEGSHVVDLDLWSCTCNRWDLTGIPCLHACAAIQFDGDNLHHTPESYVDDCYNRNVFLEVYRHGLEPMPGPSQWPRTGLDPLLPPHSRRRPGRPKKVRRREEGEVASNSKLKRSGTKAKCGRCGGVGHNLRSCKGIEDPKRAEFMRKEAVRTAARRARQRVPRATGCEAGSSSAGASGNGASQSQSTVNNAQGASQGQSTMNNAQGVSSTPIYNFATNYTLASLGRPEGTGQMHCRVGAAPPLSTGTISASLLGRGCGRGNATQASGSSRSKGSSVTDQPVRPPSVKMQGRGNT